MVYKAHEAALDRFVAIKVLSPELARDADFVRSFLREARAVAALNHPNIIQIYFIGQHDEFIYFAMELIEGHAFDRLARLEKKPTVKDWLGYFRQAALGLQYAHNHGVIHRDIKPANLILNEAGFVKVADFGLARKVGSTGESSASIADSMGTPEYMSPEESAGEVVDHRSDMYSLGASLFHMLAGKAPFSGASGTEIMMHQIHTPLPSLKKINPNIPQPAVAIIEKLMAKDPAQRYQRYEDLIAAIDAVLHGKPAATRIAMPQAASSMSSLPKADRKGPGGMVWLLVLLILGAAGFALWKIGEGQKQAQQVQPLPAATNTATTKTPTVQPPPTVPVTPVRPRPPVQPPRATNVVTQVDPDRTSSWVTLGISDSFNRNAMSRRSDQVDGFTSDGKGVLMTKSVRRELGLSGAGLPDDGFITIPDAVPPGHFTLFFGSGSDCIWFSGQNGRPPPASVRIPASQRRAYSQIAFLTTCANANGTINVLLHYLEGSNTTAQLDLHNAHRHSAGVLKNAKAAFEVTPGRSTENFTLYSQTIPCDPKRVLRHITLIVSDIRPAAVGSAPGNIVAGVFAISALPASSDPASTATNVTAPVPATNTTANVPPEPPPDYRALASRLNPLMASLQFEAAAEELKKLAAAGGDRQRLHWTQVASDLKRLQSFKQRVTDSTDDKAGRNVALSYRTGAKLDAQLSSATTDELTLRKILPNAGFMSTTVRWTDLAPSSILTVFATVADPNNTDDLIDYGLLLLYQALSMQARPEDAQRALTAAAQREPKFKSDAEERIRWLGEDKPATTTATTETPASTTSTAPRVERGIPVSAGPARWGWTCLDVSPACNADVIYTDTRAATDEFGLSVGWTTSGWLSRNNIAGDFSGIPDDGRVMLPDLEPRTVLQITMPPRRNAILFTSENGRQPKPVRLDLPASLQGPHRGIALLHASVGGDILLNLDLVYSDGSIRTRPIQTLDWRAGGRTHEFAPGQTVALSTRASRITDPARRDMAVQLVPASEERKLVALIFSYASGTPPPDIPNYDTSRAAAAIFAVSVHPVAEN